MVGFSYAIERMASGRWIAGPSIDDAIGLAKKANSKGISVLINYLGEDFVRGRDVSEAVGTYVKLLDRIEKERVSADISVKPTQIGLKLGRALMESNYAKIVDHAKAKGIFVWLDMEELETIDKTMAVYLKSVRKGNTGICVQAYLKRSHGDLAKIVRAGGTVRLVKGAYSSRGGVAFRSKGEIASNYARLLHYLFEHSERFTVATHDPSLIDYAMGLNRVHRRNVTYAMLNGINNKRVLEIAREKERMALYVPFGTRWIAYSYRRLREGGHLSLILQSLISNQTL